MSSDFMTDKYIVIKKENFDEQTGSFNINPAAKYFVLRIDKDPIAREALKAYILGLVKKGDINLATQLNDWLNSIQAPGVEKPLILKGRCPVCGGDNYTKQTKSKKIGGKDRVVDQQLVCNLCGVVRKF